MFEVLAHIVLVLITLFMLACAFAGYLIDEDIDKEAMAHWDNEDMEAYPGIPEPTEYDEWGTHCTSTMCGVPPDSPWDDIEARDLPGYKSE